VFATRSENEALRAQIESLHARIAELECEHASARLLDSVTGLPGARAFRGRLAEELERSRRYQRVMSLAIVSIDDFGALELRHGFKAGDELLVAAARRLSGAVRLHDLLGRTGQAEFGLLLPDTDAEDARPALERLLVELEVVGEGAIRAAGASMGIAQARRGMSAEGLLASARMAPCSPLSARQRAKTPATLRRSKTRLRRLRWPCSNVTATPVSTPRR
jgi:diguanylate cyclase (GGDEF)-like protein